MLLDSPQPPLDQTKQAPFPQVLTMLVVLYWTSSSSPHNPSHPGVPELDVTAVVIAQIRSPACSPAVSISGAVKQPDAGQSTMDKFNPAGPWKRCCSELLSSSGWKETFQ